MPRKKQSQYVVCISNDGYPASLETRKIYRALPDAVAEKKGFVRIIDESGEDYLYPRKSFMDVDLTIAAKRKLKALESQA